MVKRTGLIMHACQRCGGAAYREEEEDGWRCLQCARTVPVPESEAKKPRRAA
jgi:hypothetical protein